jgi:hypothetical protein
VLLTHRARGEQLADGLAREHGPLMVLELQGLRPLNADAVRCARFAGRCRQQQQLSATLTPVTMPEPSSTHAY